MKEKRVSFPKFEFKGQNHSPPTPHRKLKFFMKTIDLEARNTFPNAQKALLNCFRDRRYMLYCENAVCKHDFCDNFDHPDSEIS